jgi:hypothetical protein
MIPPFAEVDMWSVTGSGTGTARAAVSRPVWRATGICRNGAVSLTLSAVEAGVVLTSSVTRENNSRETVLYSELGAIAVGP